MTKKEMRKILFIVTILMIATTSVLSGIAVWCIGKIVIDHVGTNN